MNPTTAEPQREKAVPQSIHDIASAAKETQDCVERLRANLTNVLRAEMPDIPINGPPVPVCQDPACACDKQLREILDLLTSINRQLADLKDRLEV